MNIFKILGIFLLLFLCSNLSYSDVLGNQTGKEKTDVLSGNTDAIAKNNPSFSLSLSSPGNSLSGVSLYPVFEWIEDGSSTYTVEVSTSDGSSFEDKIIATQTGANSGYYFPENHVDGAFPLLNDKLYYWRVTAHTVSGDEVSDIWKFKTTTGVNFSVGHPANGTKVWGYDPLLISWYLSQETSHLSFRLEILEDNEFSPNPNDWTNADSYDNITDLSYTLYDLYGGTKYWWRVIVYIDGDDSGFDIHDDKVIKYSKNYNFTTRGGAVKAIPSWPTGGAIVYSVTPTLGWYSLQYEPNAAYRIIMAKDNNKTDGKLDTDVVINASTNFDGTYPISASDEMQIEIDFELEFGETYFWQIVSYYEKSDGTLETVYSKLAKFKIYENVATLVNEPVLSYPIGGAKIYSQSPTLSWYGNAWNSGITYTVQWDNNGSWEDWAVVLDEQSVELSQVLDAGVTYKWRVIAELNGNTAISKKGKFKIAGGISSFPVLSYPTGGTTVYSVNPSLGWYVSGAKLGWSGYVVKWIEKTGFDGDWVSVTNSVIINDIDETYLEIPDDLDYGVKYLWAVALYDGTNDPVLSDYKSGKFKIYGGAGSLTFTPSSPYHKQKNVEPELTFRWWVSGSTAGVVDYFVTYTPYDDPSLDPNPSTTVPSADMYVSASLQGGTQYKWMITANLDNNTQVTSGWFKFVTRATLGAIQPVAGSPNNGVSITDNSAELSWYLPTAPLQDQSYKIELSKTSGFTETILNEDVEEQNFVIDNLEDGEYFWRVKGANSDGESFSSATANFIVGNSITGVMEYGIIPDDFEVFQNYPNPFNPTTAIKFGLSETSVVSIIIYDILGQEVKTLINLEKSAGTYSIEWNGENNYGHKVNSGTYIYRVIAQNKVVTKKMVLLK